MAATSQFFLLSPLKNKPSTYTFSFTPHFKTKKEKSNLSPFRVALSDPETTQTTTSSEQPPNHARNTSVWINPKRKFSNSPGLGQDYQSHERMARLVSLAFFLDKSTSGKVSTILSNQTVLISEPDAVIVIDHMKRPENAVLALQWFLQNIQIKNETILYNVTFKTLRKSKDWSRTELLWSEMIKAGTKPDNITFYTISSCAKLCGIPSKAVEFYEKRLDFGCEPTDLSKSAIIGSYWDSGNTERALELYDEIRTKNSGYNVAFVTMIKAYGRSGNFDGAKNVFEEMKAVGIEPNLITYNVLLDAMHRARRPWQVKTIYNEMIMNNVEPDKYTYDSLIRAYSNGRYPKDALNAYHEMRHAGLELDTKLYNTLLAMCADLGLVEDAEKLFDEMKNLPARSRPDSFSYSSMITAYSCSGRVSEAERAFNEMLDAGFRPNIFILTSLVQGFGVAKQVDKVVRVIGRLQELEIKPDYEFLGCLLNVATHAPTEEFDKVVECISNANSNLGSFVKLLVDVNSSDDLIREKGTELLDSIIVSVRKPYCNCFTDICMNFGQVGRARGLLDLGIELNIYVNLQAKHEKEWHLNLKGLSCGSALAAFNKWRDDLMESLENGEKIPPLLGINTGHGRHTYRGRKLIDELKLYLGEISAPFHESLDKDGWLLTTDVAAKNWLMGEKRSEVVIAG